MLNLDIGMDINTLINIKLKHIIKKQEQHMQMEVYLQLTGYQFLLKFILNNLL